MRAAQLDCHWIYRRSGQSDERLCVSARDAEAIPEVRFERAGRPRWLLKLAFQGRFGCSWPSRR